MLSGMRTEIVSVLEQKAAELISEVSHKHEPVLITDQGEPAAYLVDVETYDAMATRIQILEGIARGERAILEGRVFTQAEVEKRWERWLK